MPINNVTNSGAEKGPGGGGRTTFRPPWVKDGPQPIPMPKAPWSKRQTTTSDVADAKAESSEPVVPQLKSVKLQSKEVKVPVVSTLKKTAAPPLSATVKPKVNEDTEGVKNGLQNLLRKSETINEDDGKSTNKSSIDERMAAKKAAAAEASPPGSVDKPGKFVRPVLKKVAKVETAPPPVKAAPPKPVIVVPVKKVESESEEEETESEEEETETETETESESEEEAVVVKKGENYRVFNCLVNNFAIGVMCYDRKVRLVIQ